MTAELQALINIHERLGAIHFSIIMVHVLIFAFMIMVGGLLYSKNRKKDGN